MTYEELVTYLKETELFYLISNLFPSIGTFRTIKNPISNNIESDNTNLLCQYSLKKIVHILLALGRYDVVDRILLIQHGMDY